MTPAELELARGAIRAVRESATGRGILGPAALRLADAADVLIEDNERMRALLILFRATALANRAWAVAQMHAADGDDTNYSRTIVAGSDELLSRIDAAIGGDE